MDDKNQEIINSLIKQIRILKFQIENLKGLGDKV